MHWGFSLLTNNTSFDVNSPQQNGDDNPNNGNHTEFWYSENGNGMGGFTYLISQSLALGRRF